MSQIAKTIRDICQQCGNDRTRMMEVVRAVQQECGCISDEAIDSIAEMLGLHRVEVESTVSFYAFLSNKEKGRIVIRLCNDIIDQLHGLEKVAEALKQELGINFGETTPDGKFSLEYTPCIGMCDQAPAALVNDVVVTRLSGEKAREMIADLRRHADPSRLVKEFGDGNNANALVRAMVVNNVRERGPVLFAPIEPGTGIKNATGMSPIEVIRAVKVARLRGRGGAGFPAGMKWEFTRAADGEKKVIICNADEGEPGTFKDRVILTELPDLVFEGMTIAGYAIGADTGLLYLRGEYAYLLHWLEHVLQQRRKNGLLGTQICGREKFNFDIRIITGAGAYVCGEETALINSCEGLRGDPRTRPPFPAQKGYRGRPTAINNVETLCCVTRIMEKGAAWFASFGNDKSTGTKLLSISGDCRKSGIYEVPFGISVKEILEKVDGQDAIAVQTGGAEGRMIAPKDFARTICFEDLSTGGSLMVFGPGRNLLHVARYFMEFFVEESCGYCTPCRVGNVLLKKCLEKILAGKGEPADLAYLKDLALTVKTMSRCGLGQTSPNPILSTLENFGPAYEALINPPSDNLQPAFDLKQAVAEEESGRKSLYT